MDNNNKRTEEEKIRRARMVLLVGVIVIVCVLFGVWLATRSLERNMEEITKGEAFQNWVRELKKKQASNVEIQIEESSIDTHDKRAAIETSGRRFPEK